MIHFKHIIYLSLEYFNTKTKMKDEKKEKTKLITAEDWDNYWAKNKELDERIRKAGHSYVDMDDQEFKNFISDMKEESLRAFTVSMKSTMLFYKNIVNEPLYHNEKKRGQRFKAALEKYQSINSKGKIISQLIKEKQL